MDNQTVPQSPKGKGKNLAAPITATSTTSPTPPAPALVPSPPAKSNVTGISPLQSALHDLNHKFVFIKQIASIATIPTSHNPRIDIYSPNVFGNSLLAHMRVDGRSVPRVWLQWPGRREVYSLDYIPGKAQFDSKNRSLNTWLPSPIKPQKGDLKRWNSYLDHLFKSDSTFREWFLAWLAYPLQHPGFKLHTACVFWSRATATGKSTLGYIMGKLYGDSNFSEITEGELHSSFNPWVAGKQFIMGEEIKGSSSQKNADFLKALITRKNVTVNLKHAPQYILPDTTNYYFTSNHSEAFYLDTTDRRFFVHELGSDRFDPFYAKNEFKPWLEDGGYEAILHSLLNIDLSLPIAGGNSITPDKAPFNPYAAAPQSRARAEMIETGKSEAERWVDLLVDAPREATNREWTMASGQELYDIFREQRKHARVPEKAFLNLIARTLPRVYGGNQIRLASGARQRYFLIDSTADYKDWTNEQIVTQLASERES